MTKLTISMCNLFKNKKEDLFMKKLKNITKISFTNNKTQEKILSTNPMTNKSIDNYKESEYIKLPFTIPTIDISQIKCNELFRLELNGKLDNKPIKIIYPKVKTDGKYFYAGKENGKRVYIEDLE